MIIEIDVRKTVLGSILFDVLVPDRVPSVLYGGAYQDQFDALLLAKEPDPFKIIHGVAAESRIDQGLLRRILNERHDITSHVVTVVGSNVLGEDMLEIGRRKLVPSVMESEDRENIRSERLALHHGSIDRVNFIL